MSNNINILSHPYKPEYENTSYKALLDLGRPTRRGVRKCPNCGYLNGNRGYMCKNSECNMIFKDSEKSKVQLDSVKLLTGTARQIYSVRVKDKGPDHRGFVQLPFCESGKKNLLSDVALCFVDSCQRSFDHSILKCHENEIGSLSTICAHIASAVKSETTAVGLEFKHDFISGLNVNEDVKNKLCLLAKSTQGPVVQSVSKAVMAVKCSVTPTNPLGYLHLMLSSSKGEQSDEFDIFYCSCSDNLGPESKMEMHQAKCIHYFACVCAFASDEKFTNKFSHFIHSDFDPMSFPAFDFNLVNMLEIDMVEEHTPILRKDSILEFTNVAEVDGTNQEIEIEVLPTDFIFDPEKMSSDILATPCRVLAQRRKTIRKRERQIKVKKKSPKKTDVDMNYFDVLSFNEWLPLVTERINVTMHYGCSGMCEPLIFHIPNRFFELLKDRICFGTKLLPPNESTTVLRETPPLGHYLKNTWHIDDVYFLKQIFDTPKVPLKLAKSFVQDVDGNFIECELEANSYSKNGIVNYVTYLNVGKHDGNKNGLTVFVIEWTPNLFEISKFGELRLNFQFGQKIVQK